MNRPLLLLPAVLWAAAALAMPPDIAFMRGYAEMGTFASLAFDDSLPAPAHLTLAGTAMEAGYQLYVVHIDAGGVPSWSRLVGLADHGECVIRAADGYSQVCGYGTSSGSGNYRMLRVSSSGSLPGNYDFGGNTTADRAFALLEYPPGQLYLGGQTSPGAIGTSDLTLVRLSTRAEVTWSRVIESGESAVALALGDTTLFIYGTADSTDSLRGRDMLVATADTAGVVSQVRRYGGPQQDVCYDAVRLSGDLTVLVGASRAYGSPSADWDIMVIGVNDAGDSLWAFTYGDVRNDMALGACATFDRDSGVVLAGWSEEPLTARQRGLLMKVSRTGDSLWTMFVPDPVTCSLNDVLQDSLYRYHAVGSVRSTSDHGLYLLTEPDPHSPGDHPPQQFSLLAPPDADTLVADSVVFAWQTSQDPDSADTVRYFVEVAFDSTFDQDAVDLGPFDSTHVTWHPDTDDVRLYWRVTARDLLAHDRLCRERFWTFACAIPDSTQPFSLATPDSGSALPRPQATFRWQRAQDPDRNDSVRYAIILKVGADSLYVANMRDTLITMSFENNPIIGEADTVQWYVRAVSYYPPMTRESNFRWWFVNWSAGSEERDITPLEFALADPYPNPFNSTTTLRFSLDRNEEVRLDIFDVQGRRVTTLTEGMHTAGRYTLTWDGAGAASGMYFAVLRTPDRYRAAKLVLLK